MSKWGTTWAKPATTQAGGIVFLEPCAAHGDDGVALGELVIAPDGLVKSVNGDFLVDEESGRLAIAAFEKHGADLPIDYEHQTLGGEYAAPSGKAPAAGWIKSLRYEKGRGIVGMVQWTDQGREDIRSKAYRYISPVVVLRKKDKKVIEIHSVALTNKPAIERATALAAKQRIDERMYAMAEEPISDPVSPDMLLGELRAALKAKGVEVADDAPREAVLRAAIDQITGSSETTEEGEGGEGGEGGEAAAEDKEVANRVRIELGLPADAPSEQVTLALARMKDDSGSGKRLAALENQLAAFKERDKQREAEALVDTYVAANKLNPNNVNGMAAALKSAMKDPAGFKTFMDTQEPYAATGRTSATRSEHKAGAAGSGAGDEEKLIANSVKAHGDNYGDGLVALQTKLIDEEEERSGRARKACVAVLTEQYPKIFG